MAVSGDAQRKVDAYLNRLRSGLRGLSDATKGEILSELRSHIADKAAAGGETSADSVDAALSALGRPEELASEYVTDELLARAEISRSPIYILQGVFRWASLSASGFLVLLASITGYFLGAAFILVAVLKPFHPETAGLWVSRDPAGDLVYSLHMGFGGATMAAGREVLGWWVVPIGLLGGCGLVILTTRAALWCVREYRRSRSVPRPN